MRLPLPDQRTSFLVGAALLNGQLESALLGTASFACKRCADQTGDSRVLADLHRIEIRISLSSSHGSYGSDIRCKHSVFLTGTDSR